MSGAWEGHLKEVESALLADSVGLLVALETLTILEVRGNPEAVLGSPAERFTGASLDVLAGTPEQGFGFRAQLAREPGTYRELYVRAAGGARFIPVELRVIHLNADAPTLALVLMRDAGERASFMSELQTAHVQLAEAFRELSLQKAALNEARRAASLSLFAAGLAHELNNPVGFTLSTARTLAAMVKELPSGWSAEDAQEALEMTGEITQGLQRVANVVKLLGEFEKDVQPAPFPLGPLLQSVAAEYQAEVVAAEGLELESDAGVLRRVLQRLTHNARRAAGPAGEVSLRAEAAFDEVRIVVEDGGPGIPPELCERIFDPFFTTLPAGQALGLGLFLARRGVSSLGGTVSVDSSAIRGSRLSVRMPRVLPPGFELKHASYEGFRVTTAVSKPAL